MRREPLLLVGLLAAACGGGATGTTTTGTDPNATPPPAAVAKGPAVATRHMRIDTAAAMGKRPMLRETYHYEVSARDPFKSVLQQVDRGPEIADLHLLLIIFDSRNPENSLVTFSENGSNRRYSWHMGERFGRITVSAVNATDVTLKQDDFGVVHTQNYTLRKPEDGTP